MLRNELTGHYRKTGERDKSLENAEKAIALLDQLDFEGTISSGTTYVNAATAYNAFGEHERSMELFEKARAVYESSERTNKDLLGGLYNNMALTCVSLGRYEEALPLYESAIKVMADVPDGRLEQAITYLNMADLYQEMKGSEEAESDVYACLDKAYELLKDPNVAEPGYYAFVLEKCAPTFSYYGYFSAAREFEKRAGEIYGKS
jgi:tetratricopeptide (TPR) repeat protein